MAKQHYFPLILADDEDKNPCTLFRAFSLRDTIFRTNDVFSLWVLLLQMTTHC